MSTAKDNSSTVVIIEIAIDGEVILCYSFHDVTIEVDTGFSFREIADQLQCATDFSAELLKSCPVRIKLVKYIFNVQFKRCLGIQARSEFPTATLHCLGVSSRFTLFDGIGWRNAYRSSYVSWLE